MKKLLLGIMLLSLAACANFSGQPMTVAEKVKAMVCNEAEMLSPQVLLDKDLASVPADVGVFVNMVLIGEQAKDFMIKSGGAATMGDTVVILSAKKYLDNDGASHVILVRNGCATYDTFFPNKQIVEWLGVEHL